MYRLIWSSLLLLVVKYAYSLQENYYWRQYTGNIPKDAVVAGHDINGNNVYVGQAYVVNEGLIVSQIYSGQKEVYAPQKGIRKVDDYIKILCGPKENFYWIPTTSGTVKSQSADKHAVKGGHEDGLGDYTVGRLTYQGEVRIGKINIFQPEGSPIKFHNKGIEAAADSYEILMFDKNITKFNGLSRTVGAV